MGKEDKKVFGIGLQKTGTSSLGRALEILGYNINHNFEERLTKALLEGRMEVLYKEIHLWDAFEDNPWPMVYKEMDQKFPGSKFILTIRDENHWLKSIIKHYGKRAYPFEKWFYKVDYPINNEEVYIQKFNNHISEVKKYFSDRPDDLLVVDWEKGDGWEQLCAFLNKSIPIEDFPHWNKNKTAGDYVRKRIRGLKMKLRNLISNR